MSISRRQPAFLCDISLKMTTSIDTLLNFDLAQWKAQIRQLATRERVLEYLQLDTAAYEEETDPFYTLIEPEMPEAPSPETSIPAGKLSLLQFQFTYWQAQQAKYDKVNLSLITLLQAIQDTVPTEIKRAIALHTTPSAAYHAVTETYKAQHVQVLQRLETQWHNLFNQASGYELIAWLDKLNTLYKRLEDLQSHTIHNAAQQLLLAIQIQNETIATIYSTTLGPTPDFITITILSSYKNYLNQQKARNEHQQHVQIGYAAHAAQPSQPPPQQSQPTTTGRGGRSGRGGRGANAASDAQGPRQPCSCGNNHSLRKCYYLNPQLRLSGWKPGKTGSEKIAQDLQQGDHRRIHIERILGHAIPADSASTSITIHIKAGLPCLIPISHGSA